MHLKVNDFHFHYKISKETTSWFKGLCVDKFGIDHLVKDLTTKTIQRSISVDSESPPTKKQRVNTVILKKELSR